jgi:hypothetical protein
MITSQEGDTSSSSSTQSGIVVQAFLVRSPPGNTLLSCSAQASGPGDRHYSTDVLPRFAFHTGIEESPRSWIYPVCCKIHLLLFHPVGLICGNRARPSLPLKTGNQRNRYFGRIRSYSLKSGTLLFFFDALPNFIGSDRYYSAIEGGGGNGKPDHKY